MKLRAIFLTLLLSLCLAACGKGGKLVEEGVELIRTEDVANHEKALACFEEADEAGNLDGSFMAGYTYDWILEAGAGQDFEKARGYYEKSPDNPYAKICLAFLYKNGQGVEADEEKAKEYMKAAYDELMPDKLTEAESKIYNAEALMLNGELFAIPDLLGEESVDYAKALEWWEKSAELGNATAMNNIGWLYQKGYGVEQDYAKALEWYEKSAELGNDWAMNNIGNLYYNGNGVTQDYAKALEWYEKSAELGNAVAMNSIGNLYYRGNGVTQDYAKAKEWWEKAAELGYANAMNNIGAMYYEGYGVEQDYAKAMEWYEKAAELGNANAMNNIGAMYYEGYGVEQDYAGAMEWWEKAAELGNTSAMHNMGVMYYDGEGVERDTARAREWWEKAAELGNANAKAHLKKHFSIIK